LKGERPDLCQVLRVGALRISKLFAREVLAIAGQPGTHLLHGREPRARPRTQANRDLQTLVGVDRPHTGTRGSCTLAVGKGNPVSRRWHTVVVADWFVAP
jgi:hypothetical protein